MTKIKNLWGTPPNSFNEAALDIRTPYTVLREQAALLEEITDNLLIGRVERYSVLPNDPSVSQQEGELKLLMVAPALDDYSYVAVTLTYPVTTLYPVTVEYDNKPVTCHSEEELLPVLEKILSSEKTWRVITNLLAQMYEEVQVGEEEWKIQEEKRKAEKMRREEGTAN